MIRTRYRKRRSSPDKAVVRAVKLYIERPQAFKDTRPTLSLGIATGMMTGGIIILVWTASREDRPKVIEETLEVLWEEKVEEPKQVAEPEPIVTPVKKPPAPEEIPEIPAPEVSRADPQTEPQEENSPPAEQPQEVFGLTEDALFEGGDMAVATGNTLFGTPDSVIQTPPDPLTRTYQEIDYEKQYLESVRNEIARHYPIRARKLNLEGSVRIRLVLEKSGRIRKMKLLKGSGHSVLDRGLLESLDRLGRFAPFPKDITHNRWELEVPVTFKLR